MEIIIGQLRSKIVESPTDALHAVISIGSVIHIIGAYSELFGMRWKANGLHFVEELLSVAYVGLDKGHTLL